MQNKGKEGIWQRVMIMISGDKDLVGIQKILDFFGEGTHSLDKTFLAVWDYVDLLYLTVLL